MVANHSADGGIDAETLANMAQAMREWADALDGLAHEMSEPKSHDDAGFWCTKCDRSFGNAGALARHGKACEGKSGDSEPETPDTETWAEELAREYSPEDVPAIVGAATPRQIDGLAADMGVRADVGPDEQAKRVAKALVREMGGGKSGYVAAFGECSHEGCDYGANGPFAEACRKHGSA